MHMIWFSVVIPSMLFVVWAFPMTRLPSIWSLCLGIAVLGIVGLVGFDLFMFLNQDGQWRDAFMKSVFSVAMNTDIPLVQFGLGCVINWAISRRIGFSGKRQLSPTQIPQLP